MQDLSSSTEAVKQYVSDEYHKSMHSEYGDAYIKYRSQWYAAINGDLELDFPLHIDFELFNSCNYRCSFCPYSLMPADRPKGFNVKGDKRLSLSTIKKVLQESNGRLKAVELGYNTEPLLSSSLIDIISLCKSYGVLDIRMSTNGSLLNNLDFLDLCTSGLSQLQVSIDAVDATSYEISRNSDKYEVIIASIKEIIRVRNSIGSLLPRIRVSYVMTDNNKSSAQLFVDQWKNLADIVALQDLLLYDDVSNLQKPEQGSLSPKYFDENKGCYMPKVRLSIRSDGTVHPCCTVPGMQLVVGNVKHMSISQIWNSAALRKIRKSHFDGTWVANKICRQCMENIYV